MYCCVHNTTRGRLRQKDCSKFKANLSSIKTTKSDWRDGSALKKVRLKTKKKTTYQVIQAYIERRYVKKPKQMNQQRRWNSGCSPESFPVICYPSTLYLLAY